MKQYDVSQLTNLTEEQRSVAKNLLGPMIDSTEGDPRAEALWAFLCRMNSGRAPLPTLDEVATHRRLMPVPARLAS
jgi:hypothetical protein